MSQVFQHPQQDATLLPKQSLRRTGKPGDSFSITSLVVFSWHSRGTHDPGLLWSRWEPRATQTCLAPRGPGRDSGTCLFLLLLQLHGQKAALAISSFSWTQQPERILHFSSAGNAGKQKRREGPSPAQLSQSTGSGSSCCSGDSREVTRSDHLEQDLRGSHGQKSWSPAVLLPWTLHFAPHVRVSETGTIPPFVWGTGFGNKNDTMVFVISWLSCWLSFYTNNL